MAAITYQGPQEAYRFSKDPRYTTQTGNIHSRHQSYSTLSIAQLPKQGKYKYNSGSYISTLAPTKPPSTLHNKVSRPSISSPNDYDPISNAIKAQSTLSRNLEISNWLSNVLSSGITDQDIDLRNEIPLTLEEVTFCLNGANGLMFEDLQRPGLDDEDGKSEGWMEDTASSDDSRIVLTGKKPERRRNTLFSPKAKPSSGDVVPMDYFRHSAGVGPGIMSTPDELKKRGIGEVPRAKERTNQKNQNSRLTKKPPQTQHSQKFKLKTVQEDDAPRYQTPQEIFSRPSFSYANSGDTTPRNNENGGLQKGERGTGSNSRERWNLVLFAEKERKQIEKAKGQQIRWWRRLVRILTRKNDKR